MICAGVRSSCFWHRRDQGLEGANSVGDIFIPGDSHHRKATHDLVWRTLLPKSAPILGLCATGLGADESTTLATEKSTACIVASALWK